MPIPPIYMTGAQALRIPEQILVAAIKEGCKWKPDEGRDFARNAARFGRGPIV